MCSQSSVVGLSWQPMIVGPEVVCQVILCNPMGLWLPPTSLVSSTLSVLLPFSSLWLCKLLVHLGYVFIATCAFRLGLCNGRVLGQAYLITPGFSPGHLSHWGKVPWSHLCWPACLSHLMAEKDSADRAANSYESFPFPHQVWHTHTHPPICGRPAIIISLTHGEKRCHLGRDLWTHLVRVDLCRFQRHEMMMLYIGNFAILQLYWLLKNLQGFSIELAARTEVFYIYAVRHCSHWPQVTVAHLKRGPCSDTEDMNFKFYLITTNLNLSSHRWLVTAI